MPLDGSAEDEIRRFEEQYRRQPESLVFARLADAYRKTGEPGRALEILEEGIARHPDYLSAHIVRARTYRDLAREDEARGAFERVLELDAQNLVAIRGLADLARRRGDRERERHWVRRLVQADPFNEEPAARLAELDASVESGPGDGGAEGTDTPVEPAEEPALPAPSAAPEAPSAMPEAPGATPEAGSAVEAPSAADAERPAPEELPLPVDALAALEEELAGPEAPAVPPEVLPAPDEPLAEPGESSATGEDRLPEPWWFEAPDSELAAAVEDGEEDADLLTRTMAELYARQGLLEEAEEIYRELLRDRPGDAELQAGLDAVLGMRAARSATRGAAARPAEPEAAPPAPAGEASSAPREPRLGDELGELLEAGRALASRLPDLPEAPPEPGAASPGAPRADERTDPEPPRSVLDDWLRRLRS